MAKVGTITDISIETGIVSIQDGQYTNKYSFTHPYVSNSGKNMDKGAATYMKEVPQVGQSVEYSYGSDNGIQFVKFLKVVSGGAPQGNPTPYSAPQAKPPSQYSGAS